MKNYFYMLVSNDTVVDEQFTRKDARQSKQLLKKTFPDVQIVQQKTIERIVR